MAGYVAAAGALISMYSQYQSGVQKSEQGQWMSDLSLAQANYNDYISKIEANNAIWQSEWSAALEGERAQMAREEAGLTFAQADMQAGVARQKRGITERSIALTESQAFDTLASNVATKKTEFAKSGVRVNTGSPESFLSSYWDKKSNEINTVSGIARDTANLEESQSLFGAGILKSKGTIQLDEASLMDSQAGYLLAQGQYEANLINTRGAYNSSLTRAQAAIYRAGGSQALTAGWLNAAGTGTTAAYNILK